MKMLAIGLTLALLPAAANAGTTGSLCGTVIAANGVPVSNARVVAPVHFDNWLLRLTPGVTFGFGMPVAH